MTFNSKLIYLRLNEACPISLSSFSLSLSLSVPPALFHSPCVLMNFCSHLWCSTCLKLALRLKSAHTYTHVHMHSYRHTHTHTSGMRQTLSTHSLDTVSLSLPLSP